MSAVSERDARYMSRAIALSKKGFPAPNPHVGCVLVLGDDVVGEGYHRFAGGPHAEAVALSVAGERARGATAYVTLEPCNHFGRTPPCSEALIRAGVSRVVVACADPNPRAAGGAFRLREEGIAVEVGLLADKAAQANTMFLTAMRLGRPYVVLKAAASLDGRIALPSGESKWITGPAARKAGHRLRAECGAVLVGRRTVEIDDPLLTARIPGVVNQPTRIVLDPSAKLDGHWKVFDGSAPTIHVVDGFESIGRHDNGFDLEELLKEFLKRGITGLLVEGGAHTVGRFLQAGLVDKIELFLAPKVLGSGPAWIEGLELNRLADAPGFRIEAIKKLSGDLRITLTRDFEKL